MKNKNILGLDLGPNSIGWAVVNKEICEDGNETYKNIIGAGSRIIPMDAATLGDFAKGVTNSQASERTSKRSPRRMQERAKQRRERLNRVLDIMGFLPQHYSKALDRYGKLTSETKIAWYKDDSGNWQFAFKDAYAEMLTEFQQRQPELTGNGLKIPYDWTIYYLRKKALHSPLTKEELAWVLHSFNQKRGYNQARGEGDDDDNANGKSVVYCDLKVISVECENTEQKGEKWYKVILENGMTYSKKLVVKPEWKGQTKGFLVTTKTDKKGETITTLSLPKESDWTLQLKKTENSIETAGIEVGEYIYRAILNNPAQKIRGSYINHIGRKFYINELRRIINKQIEFIPELSNKQLYSDCIESLYSSNEPYRNSIANRDFSYLLIDDILFYQRPLKSKKSEISNCPYESTIYYSNGEIQKGNIKCISKSNPLYQEFRLWKFIHNLRIYKKQTVFENEQDVTAEFLPSEKEIERLFDYLNDIEEISQDSLFSKFFGIKKPKNAEFPYRWNYVEDKKYPCNETRAAIIKGLKKANVNKSFLTAERETHLWHILYSVSDKTQLKTTLLKYSIENELPTEFAEILSKTKPFKNDYGAYSEKAYKKLLPLMRIGSHWDYNKIDNNTKSRIEKFITGEFDETIDDKIRERVKSLTEENHYKGLPDWLSCYIVYGRHSEAKEATRWQSPDDIDNYLKEFKQHSLNNPIVEQAILETLRTVRDIWKYYGTIDEIHVELGREMKKTAKEREQMTQRINEKETRNIRIKQMLVEFLNPEYGIDNVRPYSPSQQEILRIYEDQALSNRKEIDPENDFVSNFLKAKSPTRSEFMRYKLWLDQKYLSPYTNEPIPLSKLFTHAYEIEHIIPQSRYFDDSISNKVICESEVNKLKGNKLGLEFIKLHHGEIVQLSSGKTVRILTEDEYRNAIYDNLSHNKAKQRKLLLEDIPDEFVERQLNDTRYISKLVMRLLSNIVREDGEEESTSKNVIPCTGGITDQLKKDWGINDVWNKIILPRFQRMNKIDTEYSGQYTAISPNGHEIPNMPLTLQKGFNKKRIDHRHHAMDAIVIACATRSHVNLLNNEAAKSENRQTRYQLSRKLRNYEKTVIEKNGETKIIETAKEFKKPWETFPADVEKALREIIVSFKQNTRIITRPTNKYHKFENGVKCLKKQEPDKNPNWWAIRKSLHKDTVFGEINLRLIRDIKLKDAITSPKDIVNKDLRRKLIELINLGSSLKDIEKYFIENKEIWSDVNLKRIPTYYFSKEDRNPTTQQPKARYFATRKNLVTIFDKANLDKARKTIENITDSGIRQILHRHLESCDNDPKIAFSPEGIELMNKNIVTLNNGSPHKPIYKVRVFEQANKFAVGQSGNKSTKFVEADKGTNLFFAIYESEIQNTKTGENERKREFASIPLNEAIERLKAGLPPAPNDANGNPPKFTLSPNDLVYVPTTEEINSRVINKPLDKSRIYKMVSYSKSDIYFVLGNVSSIIKDAVEFESLNKMGRSISGEMIKEICIPIKVDRLGNIINNDDITL